MFYMKLDIYNSRNLNAPLDNIARTEATQIYNSRNLNAPLDLLAALEGNTSTIVEI